MCESHVGLVLLCTTQMSQLVMSKLVAKFQTLYHTIVTTWNSHAQVFDTELVTGH
jgi:hypothetical protein